MKTRKRKGFTLIELLAAATIFTICISLSIGIVSMAFTKKAVSTQMLLLQDSFSSVCTLITDEVRGAYWSYEEENPQPLMESPSNNALNDELIFITGEKSETTRSADRIRFYSETSEGRTKIYKEKKTIIVNPSTFIIEDYGVAETELLTPGLKQIASLYFVNKDGKITIIMNAKILINGAENNITFVDTAYVRNY